MKYQGKILHSSWGYSMTFNDYAVVISETDKTVLCKLIKQVNNQDGITGTSKPVLEEVEDVKPFRLRIKENGDNSWFKRSYPYNGPNSKRMGYFNIWDGRENYYNTND